MKAIKVYVDVMAHFDSDGQMNPTSLTWEDGRKFLIDRVISVQPAAALKAGGQGDRYTVRILGRETFLFFERNAKLSGNQIGRWFVERN